MKYLLKKIIIVILILIQSLVVTPVSAKPATVSSTGSAPDLSVGLVADLTVKSAAESSAKLSANVEMRGMWVASVVNIDYPTKPTTDPSVLKTEALKILDEAEKAGFNAVFLQVRPTADAFYKSKYFPWSKFLTGTQGKAPADGFDPLAFWITEAHKRGIELHAWINPYRITKNRIRACPTIASLASNTRAQESRMGRQILRQESLLQPRNPRGAQTYQRQHIGAC